MSGTVLSMKHRVRNAVRFKNQEASNLWIVFGKTSAWDDDANPPDVSINEDTVPEVILAKKASIEWVVQDDDGLYQFISPPLYPGQPNTVTKWLQLLTEEDVMTRSCRWCLLRVEVTGDELTDEYRVVAFTTGLVPTEGHEDDTLLYSSNISDIGYVETMSYRRPSTLSSSGVYTVSNIIEF